MERRTGVDPAVACEPSDVLGSRLRYVRWATIGTLFTLALALARPLVEREGCPTWLLIFAFAVYSLAVGLLRRRLAVLRRPGLASALDLAADDYLTKPFDHLELLARLRALVRRSTYHALHPVQSGGASDTFAFDDFSLDYATHEVRVGGAPVALTRTEYRLLEELVRNAGTALTHRQLPERV